MNDIDIKRDKIATWVKGGSSIIALGAIALLFTIILAAVSSIIAAGAIAVMGGILLVNLIPWWSMYCANLGVKLMTKQAQDNPIETLVNICGQMADENAAYKKMLVEKTAMVNGIAESVDELRKTDPEGAAQSDEDIRLYREEIAEHEVILGEAVMNLEAAQDQLTKMKGRWKIAQMHTEFQKKNPKGKAAYMRKHLVDEAYLSVQTAANRSRAQLRANSLEAAAKRQHIAEKNAPKQGALQNNPTNTMPVIDVYATTVKEKVQ